MEDFWTFSGSSADGNAFLPINTAVLPWYMMMLMPWYWYEFLYNMFFYLQGRVIWQKKLDFLKRVDLNIWYYKVYIKIVVFLVVFH